MGELSRRTFLKLTAAGGAAAAAAGLGLKDATKLVARVEPMGHARGGEVTWYATACRECPAGCGMHVAQRDGRAVKAEGNPEHPVNRGGLCARGQSSLQGLYDPDRLANGVGWCDKCGGLMKEPWDLMYAFMAERLKKLQGRVTIVSDLRSGSEAEVLDSFAKTFGGRVVYYEPYACEALKRACKAAVGQAVVPRFHLDRCRFILSLGVDFLETWISPVEFAHGFAAMRAYRDGQMGRFAYVGPRTSMTAANADEVFHVRPEDLSGVAWALLQAALRQMGEQADAGVRKAAEASDMAGRAKACPLAAEVVERLARQFVEARGAGVVLAGPAGPAGPDDDATVQAAYAAMLLNLACGNVGKTADFSRPHAFTRAAGARELGEALLDTVQEDIVVVHHSNPVFTAPRVAEAIRRAGTLITIGVMPDETAEKADYICPADYPLETWGDYEPYAGVHALMQPTMGRLYDTRHGCDVLIELARQVGKPLSDGRGEPPKDFSQWMDRRWDELARKAGKSREQLLRAGFVEVDAPPMRLAGPEPLREPQAAEGAGATGTALWLYPSIFLYDGRTANRSWIQEQPDPISTIVWGSWADVHPTKAAEVGLRHGDIVRIATGGASLDVPVRLNDLQHPQVVAVVLGNGHSSMGQTADGIGANAFGLLAAAERAGQTVTLARNGKADMPIYLAPTADQFDRDVVQWVRLDRLRTMSGGEGDKLILPLPEGYDKSRDLYPPHEYKAHRWAMVADLHRCIGCGACSVACYAENNIATVGPERCRQGREMAWLKVVPYRKQDDQRKLGWLVLPCLHCDAAPCEPVCPVFAAVHNEEGLNAQVYNRCIGTRYCSNNCPYKVRRFNWRDPQWPTPLNLQLNPEVTVRSRGVMEKCTFCIQRIKAAEYQARLERRELRDGEVVPACVQSCPAGVFTFGDLLDKDSVVSRLTRGDPRRYHLLEELNTKPAVTHLRRVDAGEGSGASSDATAATRRGSVEGGA